MKPFGIQYLKDFEQSSAFKMLLNCPHRFSTLLIDYEEPYVKRIWIQINPTIRLLFHEILPCDEAFMHSHAWASAVRILPISGDYEMETAFRPIPTMKPVILCRSIFTSGGYYEMLDPRGYHSVKPLYKPSYSVMLTYRTGWLNDAPTSKKALTALSEKDKSRIFTMIKNCYEFL